MTIEEFTSKLRTDDSAVALALVALYSADSARVMKRDFLMKLVAQVVEFHSDPSPRFRAALTPGQSNCIRRDMVSAAATILPLYKDVDGVDWSALRAELNLPPPAGATTQQACDAHDFAECNDARSFADDFVPAGDGEDPAPTRQSGTTASGTRGRTGEERASVPSSLPPEAYDAAGNLRAQWF